MFGNKILFSKQLFFCNISEEFENNKPAQIKKYKKKQLELFVDLKNQWINDLPKKKWLQIEKENFNRIEINFSQNKSIYKFYYKRFFSEKKKKIELSYEVTFDQDTGLMSFPKHYHNFENKIFFSTEIKGTCLK